MRKPKGIWMPGERGIVRNCKIRHVYLMHEKQELWGWYDFTPPLSEYEKIHLLLGGGGPSTRINLSFLPLPNISVVLETAFTHGTTVLEGWILNNLNCCAMYTYPEPTSPGLESEVSNELTLWTTAGWRSPLLMGLFQPCPPLSAQQNLFGLRHRNNCMLCFFVL